MTKKDDSIWFVAKDVCAALGLTDTNKAIKPLDNDEKGTNKFRTPGGPQELLTISESGLYTLILRSNKPEAKPFRKWVTSEVLPAIRKTGRYETGQQPAAGPRPDVRRLGGGRVVTTSLNVAEVFNKRHCNILEYIRALEVPPEAAASLILGEYKDEKGQFRPMYYIGRDAFMFLVSSFSGKQAAALKWAYITEFNRLEQPPAAGALPGPEGGLTGLAIRSYPFLTDIVERINQHAEAGYPEAHEIKALILYLTSQARIIWEREYRDQEAGDPGAEHALALTEINGMFHSLFAVQKRVQHMAETLSAVQQALR